MIRSGINRTECAVSAKNLNPTPILRIKVQSIHSIKMLASLCLAMLIGFLSIQTVNAAEKERSPEEMLV